MTKEIEKTFGRFEATIVIYEDGGDQRSDCFIFSPKGASNSLSMLLEYEEFDETGEKISSNTLEKIHEWAMDNGY